MTCREVEDRLIDLQDGRLDPASELRLHAHTEGCSECAERVATWLKLLPAMREVAPEPSSPLDLRRMEVAIERRLAERAPVAPPSAGFGLRWVAAAAAVLLIAGAMWWRWPRAPRPLDESATLAGGEERQLQLGDVAALRLRGPARMHVTGDAAHARIQLDAGELEARVTHRRGGETFVVSLPHGRVEIRGTRFVVAASDRGSWVRVEEGRVAAFDEDGTEHSVPAGERYAFTVAKPPAVPAEAPQVRDAEPAPARTQPARCSRPVSCQALTALVRKDLRLRRYPQALDALRPALHERACTLRVSACRDEIGYLDAEALRLSGDLEGAVRAYKALDRADAPRATRQNALYAAGQLERKLERLAAARADFVAAHAVAPSGTLAGESLLGAMEVAQAAGAKQEAAKLARSYLAEHPNGLGAAQARRIAGEPKETAP